MCERENEKCKTSKNKVCLSLYKSSENKFYIYVKNQEKFRKMSVESDGQNLTRLSGNQYKIYMECMENDREKAD
jgi:uncharacterized protein YcgL (UPF0745 family)